MLHPDFDTLEEALAFFCSHRKHHYTYFCKTLRLKGYEVRIQHRTYDKAPYFNWRHSESVPEDIKRLVNRRKVVAFFRPTNERLCRTPIDLKKEASIQVLLNPDEMAKRQRNSQEHYSKLLQNLKSKNLFGGE